MTFQSRVLGALALLLAALLPSLANAESKFIYVTRHAEKADASADPALSPAGLIRAQNIAATLKDAGIAYIFTTSYQRTRQTAAPLGTLLNLTSQTYDANTPSAMTALAQQLRALPGNTLLVGHSNTVPELVRLIGGQAVPAMAETEFDRVYQIAIGTNGDLSTSLLHSLPISTQSSAAH